MFKYEFMKCDRLTGRIYSEIGIWEKLNNTACIILKNI